MGAYMSWSKEHTLSALSSIGSVRRAGIVTAPFIRPLFLPGDPPECFVLYQDKTVLFTFPYRDLYENAIFTCWNLHSYYLFGVNTTTERKLQQVYKAEEEVSGCWEIFSITFNLFGLHFNQAEKCESNCSQSKLYFVFSIFTHNFFLMWCPWHVAFVTTMWWNDSISYIIYWHFLNCTFLESFSCII